MLELPPHRGHTPNLERAGAPGNVLLPKAETGLPEYCAANVSLIVALDKQLRTERARKVPRRRFELALAGIGTLLGR